MKAVLSTLNAKYIHASLALPYLKLYCEDPSWQIEILEFTINQPLEDIRTRLYLSQPDVLSFSCYIWNIEQTLSLCRDLQKLLPNCVFILGGPEVSFDAADLLTRNQGIGIVVRGEGEETFKAVLEHIVQDYPLAGINGITYREGADIYNNPDRQFIENLDQIPSPYQGDLSAYHDRLLYYESSRGCPFNCSYCLSSTFKGVRTFSMDRVKNDLRLLMDNRIRTVKFVDRTFNSNEKRAKEIMEFILEHNISTRFHFEVCADLMSDEFISFLLQVPPETFAFEIGIQSTYIPALQAVGRSCDLQRFGSNVRQLSANGNIHLHLDLIAGLPLEGYGHFRSSFNQVYEFYPDMIQLGFLKLLKGTTIRRDAGKYGYIFQEAPPYQVMSSDYIIYPEFIMLANIERLLERYYNSGEFKTALKYIVYFLYQGDAFAFFESMASFAEKHDWFRQGHNRAAEYNILMQFIEERHPDHRIITNEYLKYDFIFNNRHSPLPEKLLLNLPDKAQENLYQLLKDRSFIDQNLPEWSDLSKYDLSKRLHLAYFSLDPTNLTSQEKVRTAILFVYPVNQRRADRILLIQDDDAPDKLNAQGQAFV